MGNENSGRKRGAKARLALSLYAKHPEWPIWRMHDEVVKEFPTVTESSLRAILYNHGIRLPVVKRPDGRKAPPQSPKPAIKPKVVEPPRVKATVHGYAGRSRWSPRYVEL